QERRRSPEQRRDQKWRWQLEEERKRRHYTVYAKPALRGQLRKEQQLQQQEEEELQREEREKRRRQEQERQYREEEQL
ncbi:hypothetical protein EGK_01281, partial [Macaca mulatta]